MTVVTVPLVLAELRADLVRTDRPDPSPGQLSGHSPFVCGVQIGVQQADSHRLDPFVELSDGSRLDRIQLDAGCIEPPAHFVAKISRHERFRAVDERVIERGAGPGGAISMMSAKPSFVTRAIAAPLRSSSALVATVVPWVSTVGEPAVDQLFEPACHRSAGIVRSGGHLDNGAVAGDQVGEGPPCV